MTAIGRRKLRQELHRLAEEKFNELCDKTGFDYIHFELRSDINSATTGMAFGNPCIVQHRISHAIYGSVRP